MLNTHRLHTGTVTPYQDNHHPSFHSVGIAFISRPIAYPACNNAHGLTRQPFEASWLPFSPRPARRQSMTNTRAHHTNSNETVDSELKNVPGSSRHITDPRQGLPLSSIRIIAHVIPNADISFKALAWSTSRTMRRFAWPVSCTSTGAHCNTTNDRTLAVRIEALQVVNDSLEVLQEAQTLTSHWRMMSLPRLPLGMELENSFSCAPAKGRDLLMRLNRRLAVWDAKLSERIMMTAYQRRWRRAIFSNKNMAFRISISTRESTSRTNTTCPEIAFLPYLEQTTICLHTHVDGSGPQNRHIPNHYIPILEQPMPVSNHYHEMCRIFKIEFVLPLVHTLPLTNQILYISKKKNSQALSRQISALTETADVDVDLKKNHSVPTRLFLRMSGRVVGGIKSEKCFHVGI
ncbi:uncharacterized protein MYCFIDRAFT_174715 [Pseudocercospora fijiensis CIRAD86]|uniref:Uncharacterized protein n=1 Tax=Pseudocercospora fijiensis (strain CIRAD86) TaxID=383855 RepID=M3B1M7_PSEFD|nr:uncharacterized protein MYCFIDRAFT_174715 [Pseudocercospora fijiensis CIRAD86]EME83248.1 hypothetical protein MYCFIDRAFT_174715 [Pseudocercospora fijiensis CIRAD86]